MANDSGGSGKKPAGSGKPSAKNPKPITNIKRSIKASESGKAKKTVKFSRAKKS